MDILLLISILNDIKIYTDTISILCDDSHSRIILRANDYLNTFIYNIETSFLFTDPHNRKREFELIHIPINSLIQTCTDMNNKSLSDMSFFIDKTINTICVLNNSIPFRHYIKKFNIPNNLHTIEYSVYSSKDLVKYTANLALLSSPCIVSRIKRDNIPYLQFFVGHEVGEFVQNFKLIDTNGNDIASQNTCTISLKSFRNIANIINSYDNHTIYCDVFEDGLYFKINMTAHTTMTFICTCTEET